MAHKSIQDELLAATGQKPPKKGESRQDFLKRIFKAVQELSDEEWKELSKAAGGWSNEASPAFDGDKDLPEFPDVETKTKSEPKAGKGKGAAKAKDAEDPAADSEDDPGNGAEDEEEEAEAAEPAEAESEDKTVKKTTKKADKAKAKDKPKTKAPAKKRGSGGVQAVMAHVLKHPDDSVDDIIKALKADGLVLTPSTVSSARGFFKLVVRFLQDKKLTTKVIFKD